MPLSGWITSDMVSTCLAVSLQSSPLYNSNFLTADFPPLLAEDYTEAQAPGKQTPIHFSKLRALTTHELSITFVLCSVHLLPKTTQMLRSSSPRTKLPCMQVSGGFQLAPSTPRFQGANLSYELKMPRILTDGDVEVTRQTGQTDTSDVQHIWETRGSDPPANLGFAADGVKSKDDSLPQPLYLCDPLYTFLFHEGL